MFWAQLRQQCVNPEGRRGTYHHVGCDAEGGGAGALPVARLQHEEDAVLQRELAVLHVPQVLLEVSRGG